jgi:hypothetical protein
VRGHSRACYNREVFHVQTLYLDRMRQENAEYEMAPTNEEGQRVCNLWADFLGSRPPEFREKLPFLKRDLELEWTAAPGGVALASFYDNEGPRTMGILLAGVDAEADRVMLDAWRSNVLEPLLSPESTAFQQTEDRPALLNLVFPGPAELVPALQMMMTALCSVYFRCVAELHARPTEGPR